MTYERNACAMGQCDGLYGLGAETPGVSVAAPQRRAGMPAGVGFENPEVMLAQCQREVATAVAALAAARREAAQAQARAAACARMRTQGQNRMMALQDQLRVLQERLRACESTVTAAVKTDRAGPFSNLPKPPMPPRPFRR